ENSDGPAHGLKSRVSVKSIGAAVPTLDDAGQVDAEDRIVGMFDNGGELSDALDGAPPFRDVNARRVQESNRAGSIANRVKRKVQNSFSSIRGPALQR